MNILLPGDDDEPDVPADAVDAIVQAGLRMDQRGWVAATAGNLSVRLDDSRIAITRSGVQKGRLQPEDVIVVDTAGRALTDWGRPSAETPLHCQIYRLLPGVGAVVHGHSVAATVLSMVHPGAALSFAGYEMLKAFGQTSPIGSVDLPIVDNDQDIGRMEAAVAPLLTEGGVGYLIRGHGTYAWGPDMDTALARCEVLEFLLDCEVTRRSVSR